MYKAFDNGMAVNTAINICEKLRRIGIDAWLYGAAMFDIDSILGATSDKAKQCGYLEAMRIRLECGGLLAITPDCKILSESAFMSDDGFTEIAYEYNRLHGYGSEFKMPYFCDCGFTCHGDEDGGLVIAEPYQFSRFLDSLAAMYQDASMPSIKGTAEDFCSMIKSLQELGENYHTEVRCDLIDDFVNLAKSFGLNPQGGALLIDCETQVIYIDRPRTTTPI